MPTRVVATALTVATALVGGCVSVAVSPAPSASGDPDNASVALFFDATETAYRVADHLYRKDPAAYPQPPTREFVTDADDAHERLLSGANPIVGMSLDDVAPSLFLLFSSSSSSSSAPAAAARRRRSPVHLVVIANAHPGFLQLITEPQIVDVGQLRSQKVAVDTDTGYASALFDILQRSGLQRDADYTVMYAGATNVRVHQLLHGDFQATLLGAPFTDLALSKGYRSQGSVREELGGYQGVVLVAKQSWLTGHAQAARKAVASLVGAEQWAMKPVNRDEVLAVVAQAVPGLVDPTAVEAVTETLFGPAV